MTGTTDQSEGEEDALIKSVTPVIEALIVVNAAAKSLNILKTRLKG